MSQRAFKETVSSSTIVRSATENDIPQLVSLFFEFCTVFNFGQILSESSKELFLVDDFLIFAQDTIRSYFERGLIIFVVEFQGKVVGYISGTITKQPHVILSPEAEIIDWFVTAEMRDKNIGRQLYNQFLATVKQRGCKVLSLEAYADNKQTIETYQRMGFVLDSVILKKKI